MTPDVRDRIERFFLYTGMPHLQRDYDPREESLTRLAPVLALVFLVALGASFAGASPVGGAITIVSFVAAAAVLYGIVNLLRGRGFFAVPERVGYVEAGLLVLAPALASLALDQDIVLFFSTLLWSVLLAVVFFVLVSLGIVSLIVHIGRAQLHDLWHTASVAARAMPLVLALLLFLFLSTETWQAFGTLEGWRFGGVLALFGVLIVTALHLGLRKERASLMAPETGPQLASLAAMTPAAPLVQEGVEARVLPLSLLQRVNVGVAILTSLTLRVAAVGAAVGLFFFVFGLLVMDRELTAAWVSGDNGQALLSTRLSGREVIISEAVIRVSGLLGGFSALYFSVSALGDPRTREEFLEEELERSASVMAALAYYNGALVPDSSGDA